MILLRMLLALFVLFCGLWLGQDWTTIPQAIFSFILILTGFAYCGHILAYHKYPKRRHW